MLEAKILPELLKRYPGQVAFRIYDIGDVSSFALLDHLEARYGKAKNSVPIVFIAGKVRSGIGEIRENLEADIQAALERGGNPWPSPAHRKNASSDTDVVKRRLKSLTLVAVIGAGLSDGINPCAFTTIIFLISYLSIIGRKKRELLKTGIIYTAAVFVTYLALGLGLMTIVSRLVNIRLASRIIYGATSAVTAAVAILCLRDYVLARAGRFREMTLRLSDETQKRIHTTIHTKLRKLGIVTAALVLGVLVAMFELPCTGQIYLPIIAALSNPHLRPVALPYLVLYNLMFIIPLIMVFVVAFYGASSQNIGTVFRRHLGAIKLVMSAVFLIITGVLIYMAIG